MDDRMDEGSQDGNLQGDCRVLDDLTGEGKW